MTAPLPPSPPVRHAVSPSKPAQALQLLQGGYYVAAGLLTAFAVGLWESETAADAPTDLTRAWVVRGAGLAFAAVGAALVASGRRGGRLVPAGAGMWVALAAVAAEGGAILFGVLPATFLIDTTVQAVFLVCWVVLMFRRVGREIDRTHAPIPAVG